MKYSIDESSIQPFVYIHQKLETAGDFEIVSEEYVWKQFVYIRLQATFPLIAEREKVADTLQESRKNVSHNYIHDDDCGNAENLFSN